MSCKSGPGATHHLACDCREEMLDNEVARWKREALAARDMIDSAKWKIENTCVWYHWTDDTKLEAYSNARNANEKENMNAKH